MNAIRFVLTSLSTGRVLGFAVVAPEARYCSIAWTGQTRLERRYLSAPSWLAVEAEIAALLPPGPLPTTSPLVVALLDFSKRGSVVVQYLHGVPVDATTGNVSAVLDAALRVPA